MSGGLRDLDSEFAMVNQDLRVIGAFIDRADQLDVMPLEEGASALQALVNVQHFLGRARAALAGPEARRANDFEYEERCARLQQALAKADKKASKAHDAMWAMDFDKTAASSSERDEWKHRREQASKAVWAIHDLLRPLLEREALAGPDTPADGFPCADGEGDVCGECECVEHPDAPADSPEART